MPFSQDKHIGKWQMIQIKGHKKEKIYSLDPTNSEMTCSHSALHVEV